MTHWFWQVRAESGVFLLLTPPFSSFLPVYCCCCLANISIPGIGVVVPEFRPFFYVNVADISALENELSYVACKLSAVLFPFPRRIITFLKSTGGNMSDSAS